MNFASKRFSNDDTIGIHDIIHYLKMDDFI